MTGEDYERVALCPHVDGYFQKGSHGVIRGKCLECGWVSATSPMTLNPSRGFGFGMAAGPPNDEIALSSEGS